MMSVEGKRVLVVGLARTGLAAAKVLARHGAAVTVTDARPPWELRADMGDLLSSKIGMELGQHREQSFLKQDFILVSPGVLPDLPQLQAARAGQVPVVSEVEVAGWLLDAPIIGITGSNGKTTSTALLGEILEASSFPVFVGGNIGVPVISAVEDLPAGALVVAELSSFQLEATVNFRPHVAVLLNITPNHLDRHPSLEAYTQAKARIFANQTPDDFAILNADDPAVMALAAGIRARKVFFSRRQELPDGLFVEDGHIVYRVGNLERVLFTMDEITLRGEFNVENVLAAAAAACVVGADFEAIRRGVAAFRGVEHRLEFVREIRGVQYFNDSKATSVDATAKALSAFGEGVHLILGGKDKGAPYDPIRKLLDGRVKDVYLIGAAAPRIEKQLAGTVPLHSVGDLESAIHAAFDRAVAGDVVLLSPACASFDQFQDYEQRGRVFKDLVTQIAALAEHPRIASRETAPAPVGPQVQPKITPPEPLPPELHLEPPDAGIVASATMPAESTQAVPRAESAPGEPAESSKSGALTVGLESDVASLEEAFGLRLVEASPETGETPATPKEFAPERIYVYEISSEETAYPEPDYVATPEPGEVDVALDSIPEAEPLTDQALSFEVRPAVATVETSHALPDSSESVGDASSRGSENQSKGDRN